MQSPRISPTSKRTRKGSIPTTLFAKLMHNKIPNHPESKTNAVWIIGLMQLERTPPLEFVRQLIMDRIVSKFARFRSVVTLNAFGHSVFTELDEEIDMTYHVPDMSMLDSTQWTKQDLLDYVSKLNDFDYDLNKPLFRYLLIPLQNGECALISCVNHVLGDGLAVVEVTDALFDAKSSPVGATKPSTMVKLKSSAPQKMDTLSRIGIFLYGLYYGLTVPLTRADPHNMLRLRRGQQVSGQKWIGAAEPISLQRFKQVKDRLPAGTTLNDLFMALMAMTLRATLREDPEYREGNKLTAQFPVSIRSAGEGGLDTKFNEPHNKISYAFYDFDLSTAKSRLELVQSTKHQLDLIKLSPSPLVVDFTTRVGMTLLPQSIMMKLATMVGNIGSAQLSNVPAPQHPLYMCDGIKMLDTSFFVFSPVVCYLGILTYNGVVNCAFNLDRALNLDPKVLAKHWNNEFELFYSEVMSADNHDLDAKMRLPNTAFYQNLAIAFLSAVVCLVCYMLGL